MLYWLLLYTIYIYTYVGNSIGITQCSQGAHPFPYTCFYRWILFIFSDGGKFSSFSLYRPARLPFCDSQSLSYGIAIQLIWLLLYLYLQSIFYYLILKSIQTQYISILYTTHGMYHICVPTQKNEIINKMFLAYRILCSISLDSGYTLKNFWIQNILLFMRVYSRFLI